MEKKEMKKYGVFLMSLLLLGSCKSSGPCEYDIVEANAEVVKIEPYTKENKELYHVELSFDNSSLYGTQQYLEQLKKLEIDSTFISVNQIKVGNIYQATVSEIRSGECEPLYVSWGFHFKE